MRYRGHPAHLAIGLGLLGGSARGQSLVDPALQVTTYACCPQQPTSFAFLPGPPGGPAHLLVCEKATGRVLHFQDGQVQGIALDVAVDFDGERGLLGIAVHPDFAQNGLVYLDYTSSATGQDTADPAGALDNRVVRSCWDGATLGAPQLVLQLPTTPTSYHQGGVILFGPDRLLYGVIGNLGRDGQLQNISDGSPPDDTSIVFRIRDDGMPPADNPFFGLGGPMQKVYAYGIRNSFGLDFDPVSNVLWDTENGPASYDEVNRMPPGSNSGYALIMGPDARDPQGVGDLWQAPGSHYEDPQFSWYRTIAPTGIHFLRSDALGEPYRDDCFVGAFNTKSIYHFELTADRSALVMPDPSVADLVADTPAERDLFLWGSGFGGITGLATGPDGALYVLSYESERVFRIARAPLADSGPGPSSLSSRGGLQVWPNPFRSRTRLFLPDRQHDPGGVLRIYSVTGRLVRALRPAGSALEWDGVDRDGCAAAPGTYLVRLENAGGEPCLEAKLVRVR